MDDTFIEAQGDITVKMGVVGKENVKLTANSKITVKYLLNAKVEAAGDIVIEFDHKLGCVFDSKISVIARQGKIIGGKATALYEIQVNVSGSPNETETLLSVGRNLFIEKELAAIHKEIAKWRNAVDETMRKLKVSFGEAVFDNPKEFISKLIPAKQKSCLLMLKELSANNKDLKDDGAEQGDSGQAQASASPALSSRTRHTKTIIGIKKNTSARKRCAQYYEDPDEKIIRFSPAV